MRLMIPAVLVSLLASSQAWANHKSLFVHGVYAATYGDMAVDKGKWHGGDSFSSFRLKIGVQVLRFEHFGLGLGFQKVGFYDAQHNWNTDSRSVRFDYRGPVAEFYAFPNSLIGFSLAGMAGTGFSYREEEDARNYDTDLCNGCRFIVERSSLKVSEFSGNVTVKLNNHLQFLLGAGSRTVRGTPKFEIERGTTRTWESNGSEAWKESQGFFLIGLRGSNL